MSDCSIRQRNTTHRCVLSLCLCLSPFLRFLDAICRIGSAPAPSLPRSFHCRWCRVVGECRQPTSGECASSGSEDPPWISQGGREIPQKQISCIQFNSNVSSPILCLTANLARLHILTEKPESVDNEENCDLNVYSKFSSERRGML